MGDKYKVGMEFVNKSKRYSLRISSVTESGIYCEFNSSDGEYWEYDNVDPSTVDAIIKQFNLRAI